MIVGATVTWNAMDNIEKVAASLRATCDVTMAFDDGSDDGTQELLPKLFNIVFPSKVRYPGMLTLRRAMLFSEAQRLGAKWFVYLDHDEVFGKRLEESLRGILEHCEAEDKEMVMAPLVQFWGDTKHRMVKRGEMPGECIAWRADLGFNYYGTLCEIFTHNDTNYRWHAPRAPFGVGANDKTMILRYPHAALLHYGTIPAEKAAKRREWAKSIGLANLYYEEPGPGELEEVDENPAWDRCANSIIIPE